MLKRIEILCLLIIVGFVLGCAASKPAAIPESQQAANPRVGNLSSDDRSQTFNNHNDELLAELWTARYGKHWDYPIGPGDILEVSVPGIDELKDREVRVDENGTISLPLLGTLQAAGLSEDGLRKVIIEKAGKYLYHPQVDLFVKSFSSRQVGVLGAVRTPSMYTLNGPADTVGEMIQRAGGISDNAAQEVLLTPASPVPTNYLQSGSDAASLQNVALTQSTQNPPHNIKLVGDNARPGSAALDGSAQHPALAISLVSGSQDQRYLDLPVIPGDTIYVPRAGDVTVIGWVYTPKVIPITPGLTVLGAVAAAGGTMYAADMRSVNLIRQGRNGQISVRKVDLYKIKKHQAPDIPVQANDVVEVSYSALRIPGYAVYYVLQGVFTWSVPFMVSSGVP